MWKRALIGIPCWLVAGIALAQTPASTPHPAAQSERVSRQSVRELQQTLEALGLEPGPADGVIGTRTKAALVRFQQSEGLRATGTLDSQTRSRLAERRREHVLRLQKALTESGLDPGPADGVMGTQTRAALRRYVAAPAPTSPTPASEVITRFQRAYQPDLSQSP